MLEKVFLVQIYVEKKFFWRNASKRSFPGNTSKSGFSREVRRKGVFLEKCVEKEFFWRSASKKEFFWRSASKRCFFGEVRRKGVFLEKCVEKVQFFFFGRKKRSASKRSNSGFFITKKEKCGEKEEYLVSLSKKREVRRKGANTIFSPKNTFKNCPPDLARIGDFCTQKNENGHIGKASILVKQFSQSGPSLLRKKLNFFFLPKNQIFSCKPIRVLTRKKSLCTIEAYG